MLNELEYLRGMVPDITRCLGVELHPLSIGDLLILRRLRSPILGYGTAPRTYALAMEAVLVMSRPFDAAIRLLNSPWLPLVIRLWHWRISWFGLRRVNLPRVLTILTDHINKAYKFRPFALPNSDSEGGSDMQSPQEQILLTQLMSKFSMSFADAVNFSWSRAHWIYGSAAEMTGAVQLSTPEGLVDARKQADEAHERFAELLRLGKVARP